jgi:hypothetical protein
VVLNAWNGKLTPVKVSRIAEELWLCAAQHLKGTSKNMWSMTLRAALFGGLLGVACSHSAQAKDLPPCGGKPADHQWFSLSVSYGDGVSHHPPAIVGHAVIIRARTEGIKGRRDSCALDPHEFTFHWTVVPANAVEPSEIVTSEPGVISFPIHSRALDYVIVEATNSRGESKTERSEPLLIFTEEQLKIDGLENALFRRYRWDPSSDTPPPEQLAHLNSLLTYSIKAIVNDDHARAAWAIAKFRDELMLMQSVDGGWDPFISDANALISSLKAKMTAQQTEPATPNR